MAVHRITQAVPIPPRPISRNAGQSGIRLCFGTYLRLEANLKKLWCPSGRIVRYLLLLCRSRAPDPERDLELAALLASGRSSTHRPDLSRSTSTRDLQCQNESGCRYVFCSESPAALFAGNRSGDLGLAVQSRVSEALAFLTGTHTAIKFQGTSAITCYLLSAAISKSLNIVARSAITSSDVSSTTQSPSSSHKRFPFSSRLYVGNV